MAISSRNAEAKYAEKQKRRKGLQKTRFYCQICERQCLDENGLKCHIKSEIHMKNLKEKLEDNGGSSSGLIDKFSKEFEYVFLILLKKMHGTKLIGLNKFYQELIKDKEHVHLNSTKWNSITHFAHMMKKEGKLRVIDVSETGGYDGENFLISYIEPTSKESKKSLIKKSENSVNDIPIESLDEISETVNILPVPNAASEELAVLQNDSTATSNDATITKKNALATRGKLSFALKRKKT